MYRKLYALYGKHLNGDRKDKEKDKSVGIAMDEISRSNSDEGAMVPMKEKYLPPIRIDGPYGTASGYAIFCSTTPQY